MLFCICNFAKREQDMNNSKEAKHQQIEHMSATSMVIASIPDRDSLMVSCP